MIPEQFFMFFAVPAENTDWSIRALLVMGLFFFANQPSLLLSHHQVHVLFFDSGILMKWYFLVNVSRIISAILLHNFSSTFFFCIYFLFKKDIIQIPFHLTYKPRTDHFVIKKENFSLFSLIWNKVDKFIKRLILQYGDFKCTIHVSFLSRNKNIDTKRTFLEKSTFQIMTKYLYFRFKILKLSLL